MNEVTHILSSITQGDPSASGRLLPPVYDRLRRLAARSWPTRRRGRRCTPPPRPARLTCSLARLAHHRLQGRAAQGGAQEPSSRNRAKTTAGSRSSANRHFTSRSASGRAASVSRRAW